MKRFDSVSVNCFISRIKRPYHIFKDSSINIILVKGNNHHGYDVKVIRGNLFDMIKSEFKLAFGLSLCLLLYYICIKIFMYNENVNQIK